VFPVTLGEAVEGEAIPSESVTIMVTLRENPVEGALVEVEDVGVYITDGDGRTLPLTVPYDDGLKIKAVKGELEGVLEIDLEQYFTEEDEEVVLEGIIETINGNNWTMSVEGETTTVDVSEAEIDGEPVVGLEAVVKGTLVDGIIVASEVEVKEARG